jgi:hypothetical protein
LRAPESAMQVLKDHRAELSARQEAGVVEEIKRS